MQEFKFCQDVGGGGSKLVRDKIFQNLFPELPNFTALHCPFHMPQSGHNKNFFLCAMLKSSNETRCLMQLEMH